MTKRFTVALNSWNRLHTGGLLFEATASREDVIAFCRSPEQTLFKLPAFLYEYGDQHFVSPTQRGLPQADKAGDEDDVTVIYADREASFSPRRRFDTCTQLIKVMGCEHCEFNETTCYSRAKFELPTNGVFDANEAIDALHSGTVKVTGFEFVHPKKTISNPFAESLRRVSDHDFDDIEFIAKQRSTNAVRAAETRALQASKCGACLLGHKDRNSGNFSPGCWRRASYCDGPFASEEEQVKALLAEWDPRLEEFLKTGEFTRGQFWAIARGASNTGKLGRLEVSLSGWCWDRGRFMVEAFRRNTNIYSIGINQQNYGEVRELFKELPAITGDQKDPGDAVRALWYYTLQAGDVPARNGWGSRRSDVVYRQLMFDHVLIRTASPRYFRYGEKSLHSLYQAANYFERPLPALATPKPGRTKGKPRASQPAPSPASSGPSEPSAAPAEHSAEQC